MSCRCRKRCEALFLTLCSPKCQVFIALFVSILYDKSHNLSHVNDCIYHDLEYWCALQLVLAHWHVFCKFSWRIKIASNIVHYLFFLLCVLHLFVSLRLFLRSWRYFSCCRVLKHLHKAETYHLPSLAQHNPNFARWSVHYSPLKRCIA